MATEVVSEKRDEERARPRQLQRDPSSPEELDRFYAPIRELGLESHVLQLDTYGYAVIPPEKVTTPEFVERVRNVILRVIEERTGVAHSLARNGDPGKYKGQSQLDSQFLLYYLLFADPIARILSPSVISVFTRIMAIVLAAVAVEMIITGAVHTVQMHYPNLGNVHGPGG